jgi:hypothetical protein
VVVCLRLTLCNLSIANHTRAQTIVGSNEFADTRKYLGNFLE